MSAAVGLVGVLDDIAILADDVATQTGRAGSATAGILGDDVAVNAGQATGFSQKRELKVVWEICKGSLKNKAMILPAAFLLSAFAPWLIPIILIAGGLYLLYEGGEKIAEYIHLKFADPEKQARHETELVFSTPDNILDVEKQKIKSAVFTDFILSIEIVVIALGTVLDQPLHIQVITTTIIAFIATFGVYGLVALIIRMDDAGFWLIKKDFKKFGNLMVQAMPITIRGLTVVGTLAMILVGGGIMTHNIPMIHDIHLISIPILNDFVIGGIVGALTLVFMETYEYLRDKIKPAKVEG